MSNITMHMTFGMPQLLMSFLLLYGSIKAIGRFGQAKDPDIYDSIDAFWAPVLIIGLLWWGGFYG